MQRKDISTPRIDLTYNNKEFQISDGGNLENGRHFCNRSNLKWPYRPIKKSPMRHCLPADQIPCSFHQTSSKYFTYLQYY